MKKWNKFMFVFSAGILVFLMVLTPACKGKAEDTNSSTGGAGLLGMSLPADFRAFSASSPWNLPIPANALGVSFSAWCNGYG